ncbi:flagellar hook-length control protein FliK [Sinomonas terrae]|uniref:Flagellar hook-length control protein FliK n=1 Tax=Sinomonas terrae TaxID=2908838 RepID=A0ABS9TVS6_9MICC|nr:flagellar hook-length control protein FliK [Sinomonas terrae]MCH6468526.1 flagellar hook-length control protein FliK [Sinomonas terrae]
MPALLSPLPGSLPPAVTAATHSASTPGGTGPDAGSPGTEVPGLFAALLAAASPGAAGADVGGVDLKADTKDGGKADGKNDTNDPAKADPTLNPSLAGQTMTAVPPFIGCPPTVSPSSEGHLVPPHGATFSGLATVAQTTTAVPTLGGAATGAPTLRGAGAPALPAPDPSTLASQVPASPASAAAAPSAPGSPALGSGLPVPRTSETSTSPAKSAAAIFRDATFPDLPLRDPTVPDATSAKTDDPALAGIPSSSAFAAAPDAAPAGVPETPPPTAAQPFSAQLARPVFTLAAAGPGEHVMTVKVAPEDLGPVTVQAHIGADGVKVQLFVPTDAGRAAVQAALPELRRDLAAAGLGANLDLSARSAPQHGAPQHGPPQHGALQDGWGSGGRDSPGRGAGGRGGGTRGVTAVGLDGTSPSQLPFGRLPTSDNRLDILA